MKGLWPMPVQPARPTPMSEAAPAVSAGPLVIVGLSNILSDLLDAALARGWPVAAVVVDQAQAPGERDVSVDARLDAYARLAPRPRLVALDEFLPAAGERYLLSKI